MTCVVAINAVDAAGRTIGAILSFKPGSVASNNAGYTPWQTTGPAHKVNEKAGSPAMLTATRPNKTRTSMKRKITRALMSATLMSLLVVVNAPAQTLKDGGPPVAPHAAPSQPAPSQPVPFNFSPVIPNPVQPLPVPAIPLLLIPFPPLGIHGLPAMPKHVQPKTSPALPVAPDPLHPGIAPVLPVPVTPNPPPSVRGQPVPPILPTAPTKPFPAIKPSTPGPPVLVRPPAPTNLRVMAPSQP